MKRIPEGVLATAFFLVVCAILYGMMSTKPQPKLSHDCFKREWRDVPSSC